MPIEGEYEPSPSQWVRDQVAEYESSGGARANTLLDTGLPIIIFTTRGHRSGKVRKTPVMRVQHDGEYALVASKGGAPDHPLWYYNLLANPHAELVVGGRTRMVVAELTTGQARVRLWERALGYYPGWQSYQRRHPDRQIGVFLLRSP